MCSGKGLGGGPGRQRWPRGAADALQPADDGSGAGGSPGGGAHAHGRAHNQVAARPLQATQLALRLLDALRGQRTHVQIPTKYFYFLFFNSEGQHSDSTRTQLEN